MEETEKPVNTLNGLYELYKTAKSSASDSKEDGDKLTESFYECLIKNTDSVLQNAETNTDEFHKLTAMKASLFYEQARLLIVREEHDSAIKTLEQALDIVKEYKNHTKIIYIYLRIVNHFSYLLSKNGNLDEARELLSESEILCKGLSDKNNILIYSTDELFQENPSEKTNQNSTKFEKLITNNLQMLGWIHNKQNEVDKFVMYHHEVLRRQLEMQDGNALTWVLKCARLSSFFLSKQRFREARHHLAAALVVLQEYERDLSEYQSAPNFLAEWEELQHYYADVARYWVKYGLFLFSASRQHNIQMYYTASKTLDDMIFGKEDKPDDKQAEEDKPDDKQAEEDQQDKSEPAKVKEDEKVEETTNEENNKNVVDNDEFLLFPTLNLIDIEKQVTESYIMTTEQARSLFLFSQTWLKRSKQFYTIHEYTLDYVNAILDLSELYRFLAFYEVDIDCQYNVQKRRADVLETLSTILRDVRPQCYIAVSIELFRELAEVQMELLALNMQKLYYSDATMNAQNLALVQDANTRKMEAISDIHSRLETFSDRLNLTKIHTSTQIKKTPSKPQNTEQN